MVISIWLKDKLEIAGINQEIEMDCHGGKILKVQIQ